MSLISTVSEVSGLYLALCKLSLQAADLVGKNIGDIHRHSETSVYEPFMVSVQRAFRFKKDKNEQNRGGARPGAGRPPKEGRASEWHKKRPTLTGREPILVTARVDRDVGNLRRRGIYHAVRFALHATALRDDFRVVHFSIQRTHLHMIVEARSKGALSRGMQGLLISAARHINAAVSIETAKRRRGRVVSDRYHASVLRSPRQVRNAIAYVLNNWRRHGEHTRAAARSWLLDPFSSAISFGGWKELEDKLFLFPVRASYEPLMTCFPQTWLLRVGWMRHGPIPATSIPGRVRVSGTRRAPAHA